MRALPNQVVNFISGLLQESDDDCRILLAIDSEGFHLRKTLCVTHHSESKEVTYDTKPIKSFRSLNQLYDWSISNKRIYNDMKKCSLKSEKRKSKLRPKAA